MLRRSLGALTVLLLSLTAIAVGAGASVDWEDPLGKPAGGDPVVEEVIDFGPFDLAAMGTPGWEDENDGLVPRPAGAFGLQYALFDIVDESGAPLGKQDVHLHHFVIADVNSPDPLCDRQFLGVPVRPLVATGAERTPIVFPDGYALEVGESDAWGATWHLMNMTDQPQTVYVRYRVGIRRNATPDNTRFVTPYFLDVDHGPEGPAEARPCGDAVYQVPGDGGPDSQHLRSNSWTIEQEGILVGAGGHLHAGGYAEVLRDAEDDVVCWSTAEYVAGTPPDHGHGATHLGVLDHIVPCLLHHRVPAGERLTLESRYDNSEAYRDVMGIMMLFIWHGRQVAPPTTTTTTVAPTTTAPATTTTVPPAAAAPITATPAFTG